MKNLLRISTAVLTLLVMQAATAVPIADVVAASDKWNEQSISMEGYICPDLFTIYLASTTECDEIKEEKEGGFRIFLVLTQKQYPIARSFKSGSRVKVTGVFRIPPPGAIRETRGILAGYSIDVASIDAVDP